MTITKDNIVQLAAKAGCRVHSSDGITTMWREDDSCAESPLFFQWPDGSLTQSHRDPNQSRPVTAGEVAQLLGIREQ